MVFVNGYTYYTTYIQLFKPAARAALFNATLVPLNTEYYRQINFNPFAVISVFF